MRAFLFTSTRGNLYVMVMKDSNTGPILVTGIISRKKEHLIQGPITIYNTLKKVGISPNLHQIENEFSKRLITKIETKGLKYQIVTPGNHRSFPTD